MLEIEEAAIGAQALLDLHRQLAGGRQDQRLGLLGRGGTWPMESFCSSGRPKAAVLPVPVWAMPRRSRPASSAGMARAWMGVGCGVVFGRKGAQDRLGDAKRREKSRQSHKILKTARMRAKKARIYGWLPSSTHTGGNGGQY